jgi:GMP synthase (glutamine-hydrolysing)
MSDKKVCLAVRHVAFEDLGVFEPTLKNAGYEIRYLDIGVDELEAIDTTAPDLLVILGGPIGVYEQDRYPFIKAELQLIGQRLNARQPTIGICLGAQLIAAALGSKVYPGPEKEIGFAPLSLTSEGKASCLSVFEDAPVLHWHGDTFDLPSGAVRLASTKVCLNQAFSLGKTTIAFQFHPEDGAPGFERWLIGHTMELGVAKINVPALREQHRTLEAAQRRRSEACLTRWLAQLN